MHFDWQLKTMRETGEKQKWRRTTLLVWWTIELVLSTTSDSTGSFQPDNQPSRDSADLSSWLSSSCSFTAAASVSPSSTPPWRTISWLTTVSESFDSVNVFHTGDDTSKISRHYTFGWATTKKLGLLVVMIWLLITRCHHHLRYPYRQWNPEWRRSGRVPAKPRSACKMAVKTERPSSLEVNWHCCTAVFSWSPPKTPKTLLLNRWLACLTGSSILVLKLTFSPDPFPSNLLLSLMDWFHGFYPARVRKSLALKTLVSAAD